jgi:hypothetical protein
MPNPIPGDDNLISEVRATLPILSPFLSFSLELSSQSASIGSSLSSTCRDLQASAGKSGDFYFEFCQIRDSQYRRGRRVHVITATNARHRKVRKNILEHTCLICNTDINPATIRWNTSRVSALFFSDIFHEKIAHAYRIFFKEREREREREGGKLSLKY